MREWMRGVSHEMWGGRRIRVEALEVPDDWK